MSRRPQAAARKQVEEPKWVPTMILAAPPPPADDADRFTPGYTGHEAPYKAADGTAACHCGASAATPELLRQVDCRFDP